MKNKKKKLNLDELKVQSFVTSFNNENYNTKEIKGGDQTIFTPFCCIITGSCDVPSDGSCQYSCGDFCTEPVES
ncbi:MAG: pinensin family lanthipeptide [Balneolaceae bacterium]